ncbi:MAG: hypothetical protein NT166_10870 [Candidatus Aminicenantes bacterium]|nr:hypothetical protein [Candidatus Aminicenantes bacterium]
MATNGNMCIGGWTQKWKLSPPDSFSYVMYGMVTSLDVLKTGGGKGPHIPPIDTGSTKALWTYGGGLCKPEGYPDAGGITAIVDATVNNNWAGVDFDDECKMNTDNIIETMKQLKNEGKETSYTFIAGWDYNNNQASQAIVQKVANSGYCDRFILMCYAAAMWDDQTIKDNVGPAIEKTVNFTGNSKKVILALTPRGLNQQNLDAFLKYALDNDLGGMFIWNFSLLKQNDLATIVNTLLHS